MEVARAAAAAQPPIPPARPLRPLLKLRRLPDRALGTVRSVLEDDELFRSVVGAATTEELVGRPSWLFLRRPLGWEDELAAEVEAHVVADAEAEEAKAAATAQRRLAAVEASLHRSEAEVATVRAELRAVKERLAEARRARRAADTEAGRLRRRIEALESAGPDDAGGTAGVDREVTALRAEVIRLEAALAAAVAPAPPERVPIDRAPVAGALEALDRARHELARWLTEVPEPRPVPRAASVRPTTRRRPAPLPPAVFDDTVEAAEHLARVPGVVLLVDGYNVTKLRHPEFTLAEQRDWLLDACSALAARCDAEIHLVFDGADDAASAPAVGPRRASVNVRFTEAGVEADDEILALVAEVPGPRPAVVVTDDRRIREGAAFHGVNLLGSGTFVELLRR